MSDAAERLIEELRRAVGAEHVITDAAERTHFSQDMSLQPFERAAAVVRPASAEEVAAIVASAHAADAPLVARGGGMTYTSGYTPALPNSVLLDMTRLEEIREINAEDLYVTVECGCTWERLYRALREQGLRTPFAGTSSGRYATVGGTLSTNGVFLGCSKFGTAADSVLGLEVVTADGTSVQTGSGAHRHGTPFFRYLGPDLTGLFLADTGAFGVKTAATLKLLPQPEHARGASFAFPSFAASIDAMAEMGRFGIASEIYSFDPRYNKGFVELGFEFLDGVDWSVHMSVEAYDERSLEGGLATLSEIGRRHGTELDPVLPTALREDPFGGVRWALLDREGEIWMPTHAILPFSRAQEAAREAQALLDREAELMRRVGITSSYQTVVVGPHWIFEVAFYWADEVGRFRLEKLEPEEAERFGAIPANPEARREGLRLRKEASALFDRLGGIHLQIGRYYEYESVLEEPTWELLRALKSAVDPRGLVNPGSLGLR
ncbi:MAG: FAD-binding oxidoreductase [Gaiellaceae bacterium]